MRGPQRRYKNQFLHDCNLAFVRSRAQARFRNEQWDLTLEQYIVFWRDEDRWRQRGRAADSLVLTRWDIEKPWNKKNCCIITRQQQLEISVRRKYNRDERDLYQGAITYGH